MGHIMYSAHNSYNYIYRYAKLHFRADFAYVLGFVYFKTSRCMFVCYLSMGTEDNSS